MPNIITLTNLKLYTNNKKLPTPLFSNKNRERGRFSAKLGTFCEITLELQLLLPITFFGRVDTL